MGASIEFLIIRALPGSLAQDPKHITGGRPKYSASDIQMVHSVIPTACWDAAMARHGDRQSESRLLDHVKREGRERWVADPTNQRVQHSLRELDRISEVAVIKYLNPRNDKGETWTDEWAAKYISHEGHAMSHSTWLRKYRAHQRGLERHLSELWEVAARAVDRFVYGENSAA